MQAKTTNLLLLCAMISTGMVFGMEEPGTETIIETVLRKTLELDEDQIYNFAQVPNWRYKNQQPHKLLIPAEGLCIKASSKTLHPRALNLEIAPGTEYISFHEQNNEIEIKDNTDKVLAKMYILMMED